MKATSAAERIVPLEPPHPPELEAHLASLMPKGWTGPALRLFRLWGRHLPMAEALRGVGRYVLARGTLTAHDREVLILRYIEQLSAQEISAILGITLSSVYARHMRALERIRELVEQASQES